MKYDTEYELSEIAKILLDWYDSDSYGFILC